MVKISRLYALFTIHFLLTSIYGEKVFTSFRCSVFILQYVGIFPETEWELDSRQMHPGISWGHFYKIELLQREMGVVRKICQNLILPANAACANSSSKVFHESSILQTDVFTRKIIVAASASNTF
jgi:hypothetical protein